MQFFDTEECAWSDTRVFVAGAEVAKLRGINYSIESDDKELHAAGDEAISIQSGNIMKNGSMKLLKGAVDDWNRAAVSAGARFLTDLKVDVVVSYIAAPGRPLQVDTLIGLKVSKLPKGWEQGADHMDCELPFKFLRIKST